MVTLAFVQNAAADDFINKKSKLVWKVAECSIKAESVIVRPCFKSEPCPPYEKSKYFCLKSNGCGDSFANSAVTKNKSENFWLYSKPGFLTVRYNQKDGVPVFGNYKSVSIATVSVGKEQIEKLSKNDDNEKGLILYPDQEFKTLQFVKNKTFGVSEDKQKAIVEEVTNVISKCPDNE